MFYLPCKENTSAMGLEANIKGCFDNISHDWMIANVPTDKAVLKKWLKAGFVYQNELFPTEAGTPQGGIISPVLANMTLDGLAARLVEKLPQATQAGLRMHMVRYADDFIITGNSKEWLELEVKPVKQAEPPTISKRYPQISPNCLTKEKGHFKSGLTP